jgi:MscS family membrane protein
MSRRFRPLLVVVFVIAVSGGAPGQIPIESAPTKTDTTPAAKSEKTDPTLAAELASPRATLRTFLEACRQEDMKRAALTLDISHVAGSDDARELSSQRIAAKLNDILSRLLDVDLSSVPDDPEHPQDYSLVEGQDIPDETDIAALAAIKISRTPADKLWRFSSETVDQIDTLREQAKDRKPVVPGKAVQSTDLAIRLSDLFPNLQNKTLVLKDYQWICLAILIFLGFLADILVRLLLRHLTAAWFRFMRNGEQRQAEKHVWRPLGLLAQALVWYGGIWLIDLNPLIHSIFGYGVKTLTVVSATWTAFRLTDLLSAYLARRAAATPTRFDDLLVQLLSKSLKALSLCAGLILFSHVFALDIWGLMGGLGIGGLALAFAAKDTIGNFFGSLTVLADRPFEIGDWIITEGVEGSVENVGFRSTRLRTFYNSVITLPNSRLTTAVVDNMGRRRFRRFKETIGIQYDSSPEQMEAFCEGIRELIRRHPYTRKDYYHVYFNGFGDNALNILLYCFVETPDWATELREKHRLFQDISRLAASLGVSFAFPTRTIHLVQSENGPTEAPQLGDPIDAGRLQGAEIAGPPATTETRPGPVVFTNP